MKLFPIDHYTITYSQKVAGFST